MNKRRAGCRTFQPVWSAEPARNTTLTGWLSAASRASIRDKRMRADVLAHPDWKNSFFLGRSVRCAMHTDRNHGLIVEGLHPGRVLGDRLEDRIHDLCC